MFANRWMTLTLVAVFTIGFQLIACAPSVPPEYPAKRIWWVVPSRIPGEGLDEDTQLVAKYLPDFLPHKVMVVADRIHRGTMHVYNSPPDGYSIVTARIPLMVANQIMENEAGYDLRKMTPLGLISADSYFISVNPNTPYYTLKDLQQANEVKFGITSVGTLSWLMTNLITRETGINAKFITATDDTENEILACVRGEIDAIVWSGPEIVDNALEGNLRLICYTGSRRYPLVPDVVTIGELGYPKVATTGGTWWRGVFGPPNMPRGIAGVLKDALLKTLRAPGLLAEAETNRRPLMAGDAGELKKTLDASFEAVYKYLNILEAELEK